MAKKDSGANAPPKKPLTAFFLYKADVYEKVKAEFPEKKMTDLTKVISERWGKIDPSTKADYEKKHQALKSKYEKDKEEHEAIHGKPEKKKRKSKGKKKGSDSDDGSDDDSDDDKPAKKRAGKKK
mmetsp:Transcript_18689/g.21482  ORF Transcript_18689/g.21482 Transcript_18689/m.21482 type:complete len:125 (-) Transcript_18689:86-460(-)|eukprot:CAMPEP_0176441878 /NCGR_PEP_ID=MMETSP0127-20121128/21472_1 /TAXON_ID=938130 /ORGANISM="Platyophrya macrostoma, Strain WH" /LENGTH=124 /DNA_ID=CAMNT_0017826765 /DNA_START=69 /DNA_END=443 /DNA_ORIENTATION=+